MTENLLMYLMIFFINVIKNLNITVNGDILCEANNIKDPVLKAIEKYKKHPSIKAIAGLSKNYNFILEKVSYEELLHKIKQLDTKKQVRTLTSLQKLKLIQIFLKIFFIKFLTTSLQH